MKIKARDSDSKKILILFIVFILPWIFFIIPGFLSYFYNIQNYDESSIALSFSNALQAIFYDLTKFFMTQDLKDKVTISVLALGGIFIFFTLIINVIKDIIYKKTHPYIVEIEFNDEGILFTESILNKKIKVHRPYKTIEKSTVSIKIGYNRGGTYLLQKINLLFTLDNGQTISMDADGNKIYKIFDYKSYFKNLEYSFEGIKDIKDEYIGVQNIVTQVNSYYETPGYDQSEIVAHHKIISEIERLSETDG